MREGFGLRQLRQCPYCRAAHDRAWIGEQALGLACQRGVVRVADRNQHVADEAVAADALDRRFRKQAAKRRIVEPRQRRKFGRTQRLAGRELRLMSGLRKLVPRADREAVVTAIDAIADGFAKFAWDRPLVLDGEIGNAAPRIEFVRCGESGCRTDVEATPA